MGRPLTPPVPADALDVAPQAPHALERALLYSGVGDDFENLGIKILKSIAVDIKYSFVYGMNFITITV